MAIPQKQTYTIDDIYSLPDGTRAELIDRKGGTCEVDIAPFAVFLNESDATYVEPDIMD